MVENKITLYPSTFNFVHWDAFLFSLETVLSHLFDVEFWFVAPLDGQHGRMGSDSSLGVAYLVF